MSKEIKTFIETRLIDYNLEESSNGVTIIKGKYQQAGEVNENGRDYPQPVWDHIFKESDTMSRIRSRAMIGELEHPADGQTKLPRGSHIVTNLWQDETSRAILGASEVVPTPNGLILEAYVSRNVLFGVSSRGKGTSTNRNGVEYVDPGFILETFDFVYNPSTRGAYPKGFQKSESIPFDVNKYNIEGEDLHYVDEVVPLFAECTQILNNISKGIFVESRDVRRLIDIEKKLKFIESKESDLSRVCESIQDLILEAKSQMSIQKEGKQTSVMPNNLFENLTNTYSKGIQEGIKIGRNISEMEEPEVPEEPQEEMEEPEVPEEPTMKERKKRKKRKTKKESEELDTLPEMESDGYDEAYSDYPVQPMANGSMPTPSGQTNNAANYTAKHREIMKHENELDQMNQNAKAVYGEMDGDEYGEGDDIGLGPDGASYGEMGGGMYAQENEDDGEGDLGVDTDGQPIPKRDPVLTMALTGESYNGNSIAALSKAGLLKLVERLANGYESSRKLNEALVHKCKSLKESNKTLSLHYESSINLLGGVVERVEDEKKQSVINEAIKEDPSIEYLRPVLEDCSNVEAIQECIAENKRVAREAEILEQQSQQRQRELEKTESAKRRRKKVRRKRENSIFDESISANKDKIKNTKQKKKPSELHTESKKNPKNKKKLEETIQMNLVENIAGQHGWK